MDSLAFAVGEPETNVQAPKAKGFRNRTLFGFPTPRSRVYRAVCGGAPQTFLPKELDRPRAPVKTRSKNVSPFPFGIVGNLDLERLLDETPMRLGNER
jgi:hypothetical protein